VVMESKGVVVVEREGSGLGILIQEVRNSTRRAEHSRILVNWRTTPSRSI
jgi:hypothetical protein